MRKYSAVVLSILTLSSFGLVFSACNKDDEPTKYQLSFSESSMTVDESDEIVEVEIKLDKPAPDDITVEYSFSGTAYDDVRSVGTDFDADFIVDGDYGEVEIEKGESSAIITLILFSDDYLEDDETIEITIDEVSNKNVQFESSDDITITLNQENGMLVLLEWPEPGTEGVADMDMLVRIAETSATPDWDGIFNGSVYRGFEGSIEGVFIPNTYIGEIFGLDYTNTTYGLTYTYYDGTLDPLNFTSTFIEFKNGDFEEEVDYDVFEQTYTALNKNKWVNETGGVPTIIAQTFVNNNGVFSTISEISVQAESSRTGGNSSMNDVLRIGKPKNSVPLESLRALPQNIKHKLNLK